jgi:hypothetical protein
VYRTTYTGDVKILDYAQQWSLFLSLHHAQLKRVAAMAQGATVRA